MSIQFDSMLTIQGVSLSNDLRQVVPKPYYEYWVALLPQSELNVKVHNMFGKNIVRELAPPAITKEYPRQQNSYETASPVAIESFGETVRAPLGYIVAGRVSISTWKQLSNVSTERRQGQ
jgi:hypothetical protein